METIYFSKVIVCEKKKWRENDLRFFLFTESFGTLEAMSVGSRKIKSKLSGHLNCPGELEVVLVKSKYGYKIIQAYLVEKWEMENVSDFYYISAILEIVHKVVKGSEYSSEIWHLLIWALQQTESTKKEEKKLVLNLFIIRLSAILGYQINKKVFENFSSENDSNILKTLDKITFDRNDYLKLSRKENEEIFMFLHKYLNYIFETGFNSLVVFSS